MKRGLSKKSLTNSISDQLVCSELLDDEPIEHHDKYQGKRISRGLLKSQEDTINADVNRAYHILKKAFLNALKADRIEDVG